MHNIKDLRKNLDLYEKKFKARNLDFDKANFNKLDELNRKVINEKEKLEQEKKVLSKSKDKSNFDKSKKISEEIAIIVKKQSEIQNQLNKIVFSLPNIHLNEVPEGRDERFNKLIKKSGKIKNFTFKVKSHTEIGSKEKKIDFDISIKLSGSRFVVLREKFALLNLNTLKFRLL